MIYLQEKIEIILIFSSHRLISFDKTPIFYLRGNAGVLRRGVFILLHGMGEYGGRYRLFGESIAALGFDVWLPDIRGFGQSGGRRGHCLHFDEFRMDLEGLYRYAAHENRGLPIFLMGHSFGGLVAAYSIAKSLVIRPKGLVFSSPLFGIALKVPLWKKAMARLASTVYPSYAQDSLVNPDELTHDESMRQVRRADPGIHNKITARLYTEMASVMHQKKDIAERIRCAVLLLQAGSDRVVSVTAALSFYNDLSSTSREKEVYEGWYHELLSEVNRPAVYSRIGQWLLKQN